MFGHVVRVGLDRVENLVALVALVRERVGKVARFHVVADGDPAPVGKAEAN